MKSNLVDNAMIYAISDLHLGFAVDKPMDVFSPIWLDHSKKIKENWESIVTDKDTVLIAGDISWASKLQEAVPDLVYIENLPGKKILFPGNHDMWWSSVNKLKPMFDSITFVKHGFVVVDGVPICGSRGWFCPDDSNVDSHTLKIFNREMMRIEATLKEAVRKGYTNITLVMHFPPTSKNQQFSGFTDLIERYPVTNVIYGHLHDQEDVNNSLQGIHNGVHYKLVSSIALDFKPIEVAKIISE